MLAGVMVEYAQQTVMPAMPLVSWYLLLMLAVLHGCLPTSFCWTVHVPSNRSMLAVPPLQGSGANTAMLAMHAPSKPISAVNSWPGTQQSSGHASEVLATAHKQAGAHCAASAAALLAVGSPYS